MPTTSSREPVRRHAILLGVPTYQQAEYRPLPAAANSVKAMKLLLNDAALCGWPDKITTLSSRTTGTTLLRQIKDIAEATTDVLLLYYVGHGDLTADGELCLTVHASHPDYLEYTSLPWASVAKCLRSSPARVRISILDCCFAGRAIETLSGEEGRLLANMTQVHGVYTLTATTANMPAHVPPRELQERACTSFTDTLVRLVREGMPGKPPQLSFGVLFPELQSRLALAKLPTPNQRGTGTVADFSFAVNVAARHPRAPRRVVPESASASRAKSRTVRPPAANPILSSRNGGLLDESIEIAHRMGDVGEPGRTLLAIAQSVAVADPARSKQLADLITIEPQREEALAVMSLALAEIAPDRAADLLGLIGDDRGAKPTALARTAAAMTRTDAPRARALAVRATALAETVIATSRDQDAFEEALRAMATAVALTDPERAERLLRSLHEEATRFRAVPEVAAAMARIDVTRAEELARRVPDGSYPKAAALIGIAAATAPDRRTLTFVDAAVRATEAIADTDALKPRAFDELAIAVSDIARRLADDDADEAERVVRLCPRPRPQAEGLARIAKAVGPTAPQRAGRLLEEADGLARAITPFGPYLTALALIAAGWTGVDPERAVTLADQAEADARENKNDSVRAFGLAALARVWAARD